MLSNKQVPISHNKLSMNKLIHRKYMVENKPIFKSRNAKIYKCKDVTKNKELILKITDKEKTTISRLKNQVEALKRVAYSDYIINMVEHYEDLDNDYIIMEKLSNVSPCVFFENKTLNENELSIFTRNVLYGLIECEQKNIIHCDIKNDNILLENNNIESVKIIDFDLAVINDSKSKSVNVKLRGTPPYMSPEVLEQKIVTKTTDIWSLGILLYLLVFRTYPFDGRSLNSLYSQVMNEEPNFYIRGINYISDDLIDFIKLCLTKDYTKRPLGSELYTHPFIMKSV